MYRASFGIKLHSIIVRLFYDPLRQCFQARQTFLASSVELRYFWAKSSLYCRRAVQCETAEHKRALTTAFDEKAKGLDAQYEERSAAVEARAQELDKLRRDLDDRSARHARRQQSRELQEKLSGRSKKFELTSETQHTAIRHQWPCVVSRRQPTPAPSSVAPRCTRGAVEDGDVEQAEFLDDAGKVKPPRRLWGQWGWDLWTLCAHHPWLMLPPNPFGPFSHAAFHKIRNPRPPKASSVYPSGERRST